MREIVTLERMHRAFEDGLMEVRRGGAAGELLQRGGSSSSEPAVWARLPPRHCMLMQGCAVVQGCAALFCFPIFTSDLFIHVLPWLPCLLFLQYGMMKAKKKAA